jgi:hypothetical protein
VTRRPFSWTAAESLQLVRTGKPLSEHTFLLHIQQQTCGPNPYCLLQIAYTTWNSRGYERAGSGQAGNCAAGVEREISTSSGVMSAGMLANSGVLR